MAEYGSGKAQDLISGISGAYTSDDEVKLLNGLLALGYDPAAVAGFSDRDPNRGYLGDAVTRALRYGITEDEIRKAIAFDQVARTEHDPVKRVQGLAQALGVDMGRVTEIANRNGGSADAWINAVNEVGQAGRQPGRATTLGTDTALATFGAYARSQQATYIARGEARQGAPGAGAAGAPGAPGAAVPAAGSFAPNTPGVAPYIYRGEIQRPGTAPGSPGGGGGGAGRGTATQAPLVEKPTDPFPSDPSKVRDWLHRNAPEWAYLLDIPEVAAIIRDPNVWKDGADSADLQARLMQTDWWKRTEPSARQWLDLKARDPASAADQVARKTTDLRQLAQQLGITIPEDRWSQLAEDALKYSWDDNEVRTNLGAFFTYDQARLTGAAQAASADMKQAARDWLVPIDDRTLADWTTQVVRGQATTDYFHTYLAGQATSLFPQLADPISRGITPTQWMAPYKTMAAQTLDLNPEDIDLRDPKWLRAISQVDDKGNRSAMTLYDWQNLLRTDDTYGWDKTQQGRDHGASLARSIAAQFGFTSGGGL